MLWEKAGELWDVRTFASGQMLKRYRKCIYDRTQGDVSKNKNKGVRNAQAKDSWILIKEIQESFTFCIEK